MVIPRNARMREEAAARLPACSFSHLSASPLACLPTCLPVGLSTRLPSSLSVPTRLTFSLLPVCLPAIRSIYPSLSLPPSLPAYFVLSLPACLSVCLPPCLSVGLSSRPPAPPHPPLPAHLRVSLPAYPSACLPLSFPAYPLVYIFLSTYVHMSVRLTFSKGIPEALSTTAATSQPNVK